MATAGEASPIADAASTVAPTIAAKAVRFARALLFDIELPIHLRLAADRLMVRAYATPSARIVGEDLCVRKCAMGSWLQI